MTLRHGTREGYETVVLAAGDLEAEFAPKVGMIGCSLRHRGEELLGQRNGLTGYAESASTMGIPFLHPWANRLEGLRYEFAGRTVELDPDSPLLKFNPPGCPIHGVLAASSSWEVEGGDEHDLSALLHFDAHEEYLAAFPFPHQLRIDVSLTEDRLDIDTILTPTSDSPVPVSFGYHPYLTLPGVPRADWHVEIPVKRHLLLDDRMIPTGESEPVDIPSGPLGDRTYDDGFADLDDPAVFVLAGGGRRIEVHFETHYPYAQVFAPPGEDYVCYEPMTAPTNALVGGGPELPVAQPGTSFRAEYSIAVVDH